MLCSISTGSGDHVNLLKSDLSCPTLVTFYLLPAQMRVGLGELGSAIIDRPKLCRLYVGEASGWLIRRDLHPATKDLSGHLRTCHCTQPGLGRQVKRNDDRAAFGARPFEQCGRRSGGMSGREGFRRRGDDPDTIRR